MFEVVPPSSVSVIRLQLEDLAVERTLNRYLAITYSGSVGSESYIASGRRLS
jgi:hypothetical protein